MTDFQTDSIHNANRGATRDADHETTRSAPQATTLDPASDPANILDLDDYQPNPRSHPRSVASLTNSPRCAPAQRTSHPARPSAPRRVRTVRVDAWAQPASANWSRTRSTIRKVSRTSRSTDWALPF